MPQDPDDSVRIALERDLLASSASSLKTALLQTLERARPVVVDASAVERAGTAQLQVLLAYIRLARSRGIQVRFSASSRPFWDTVTLLGFAPELEPGG